MRGSAAARDMRQRDQRIVDRVRREVDEPSLERPVLLDGALAREAPVDIVVGAEHGGDAREDFGLVPLDPSQLRGDELLIDPVAGLGEKGLLVDLGAKLLDFRAAARVALLDAGPQQAPGGIEQDDGGQHAGHADRGDVGRRDAARAQKLAHDLADVAPPLLGILLRPADMVRAQGDRARGEGEGLVRRADEDADGRGRADVEAENAGHGWRLACLSYPRKRVSKLAPDRDGCIGFPRSRE